MRGHEKQNQQRHPRVEEASAILREALGVSSLGLERLLGTGQPASLRALDEEKAPSINPLASLCCSRYMCSSVMQRAMVAPVVWIIVTLLDGKCLICAFSGSVDPQKFVGFANVSTVQVQQLLAKVPCKDDELMGNNTSRKAVSRYLRCWSQVGPCWQSLSVSVRWPGMWHLLLLFLDLPSLHCGQAGSKAALCFFLPPNVAMLS